MFFLLLSIRIEFAIGEAVSHVVVVVIVVVNVANDKIRLMKSIPCVSCDSFYYFFVFICYILRLLFVFIINKRISVCLGSVCLCQRNFAIFFSSNNRF